MYAIVLLTDSYVDVNADLMYTTFAFDFGITAYVSTDSTNPRDITDRYSYFIYSDDSYNVAKSFSGLLKAGTYFIEIYRKSDCPTSNIVEYNLSVTVQKDNTKRANASIADLKFNKKLPAAIWLSDFLPVGYSFDPTLQKTYFYQNTYSKNEFEYVLDDLRRYTESNEEIHMASIYVWDSNIKTAMHEIFYRLSQELYNRIIDGEKLRTEVTLTFDIITGAWKIIGTIIKASGVSLPVSIILQSIDSFVLPYAELLIDQLLPKLSLEKTLYYGYLQRYIGVLEGEDNNKVVEFPFYYYLNNTNPTFGHPQYNISFSPTVEKVVSSPETIYKPDTIFSQPDTSIYSNGRVYGLSNSDPNNFNNLVLAEDYSNVSPIAKQVYLTSPTSPRTFLNFGEYQWYSFNAPQTKEYYFLAQGNHNIHVDVFNNVVDGYSNNGLIRTHTTKYTSPNDETSIGTTFSEIIETGKTVFFRVRGKDYTSTINDYDDNDSAINFIVSNEQFINAYEGTTYIVNPEDYNFQPQYYFTTTVKSINIEDFSFITARYRTGFIESEYINLSPRRKNAGFSFLEYVFNDPVLKIDIDLSFWGAYEYINNTNATAIIEYTDYLGNLVTALDLLNDIELSTDRYNQNTYTITFPINGTKRFRYYMTSEAVGDQNRGRISIGTTKFYVDKL